MQTFLPYPDFKQTVKSLDKKRLFKQLVEAKQILCILKVGDIPEQWKQTKSYSNPRSWKNHPAVQMWVGYEECLREYYNTVLTECLGRLIKTVQQRLVCSENIIKPWWLGDENYHRAMRARLIEKDYSHYFANFKEDFGFNNSEYFWPVNETRSFRIIKPKSKPKPKTKLK